MRAVHPRSLPGPLPVGVDLVVVGQLKALPGLGRCSSTTSNTPSLSKHARMTGRWPTSARHLRGPKVDPVLEPFARCGCVSVGLPSGWFTPPPRNPTVDAPRTVVHNLGSKGGPKPSGFEPRTLNEIHSAASRLRPATGR